MNWSDRIEVEIPGQRKIINQELRYYPHLNEPIDSVTYPYTEEPSVTVHMSLKDWTHITEVMDLWHKGHKNPWIEEARQRYVAAMALVKTGD